MSHRHITFEKEELKKEMERLNVKTPEEVIENWARSQYPIDSGVYFIKRLGKTFIDIGEMV